MNNKVCCFNNRFLTLVEVPPSFKFSHNANKLTLRQTINLYPNFIQKIANDLEKLYKSYRIVAILYRADMTMMNNFPNGVHKNITYYVYYTNMDDCIIDNVFYDELLSHLTDNMKMSFYVAQVFLQSLRHGFNKPDRRIEGVIRDYNLQTHHDDLQEIRRLVLNLSPEQKRKIETYVAKNSTFDSILPNMLLLNVTNCIQQESLSIKHSDKKNENDYPPSPASMPNSSNISEVDEDEDDDITEEIDIQSQNKFKSYTKNTEFQQHFYYCSYGNVVIVDADLQMSTFNNLIMKNIVLAFLVSQIKVDQLHVYLYIDEKKFHLFSKIRIHGKILQYKIHNRYLMDTENLQIFYNINLSVPHLYSTAPMIISNTKSLKETFKAKIKVIQMYLIVCTRILHKIMRDWNCICKVLRVIISPYDGGVFYHVLIYINEHDTDFLYEYLPANGMNNLPCPCEKPSQTNILPINLPHSQKLWQSRPCIEILFHTHFDWTLLKIHNDYLRRQNAQDIFQLYDIYDAPGSKLRIAHLLESKVFKATIENMTTFKFFNETGLLYPFETSGHEELYIYTLIKMTRIVYRCIVLPLTKLEKLSSRNLLPSKFLLTYAFIDDPLTPTTSVRGPQSTRNLKSIESSERMFDTKVINVTMLMNSFNLCGSESSENAIKM
ncbi:hypothetical protein [Drosophila suzukii associated hytrosavirus 1]|nr:hypothetical protein [Drosophila suzukii associated hytrosavirus 1]